MFFKKPLVLDILSILLAGIIYGFAFVVFLEPAKISPGGITGLAAITHYLIPVLPTGTLILILNIPLFILGFLNFGKVFVLKSFFATLSASTFIDVFEIFLPRYNGDRIMSALFAGVLTGASLAIILLRGFTTGGIDIVAKLLILKKPFISFGRIILFIDGFIVLIASFVYRDIETCLCSVVMLFTASKIIDSFLYGADKGKLMLIITENAKELTEKIMEVSKRGVTIVPAIGGYTGENKKILICAFRIQEIAKVRKAIKQIDSKAFIIISEVGEILGLGFKNI